MKKIVSILLVLVMILSNVAVFADEDTSKAMETVLIGVKSKISIPAEFSEFNPYSYENDGNLSYTFSWSKKDENAHIEVGCDEKGRINRYYFYDNSLKSEKKLTSLSKDDIIKYAEAFLKKAVPEAFVNKDDLLIFDDSSWYVSNNTYRLTFGRMYKGVAVKDNFADLRVVVYDDVAYVRNMSVNYNYETEFLDVTHEEELNVEKAYSEAFPIELIYKDVYSYNDKDEEKNKTALVYRNKDSEAGYISASDGKIVVEDEDIQTFYDGGAGGGVLKNEAALENALLTEQEIKELSNIEGVISKTEAGKILKNLPHVKISSDMELKSFNISQHDDVYFINVRYETKGDNDYKSLSATLNGVTGKVTSLYSGGRYDYEKKELTDAEKKSASSKINEFLKAVADEEFKQCKEQQQENSYDYTYSKGYDRYVNDVRYVDDGIDVAFNVKTGEITSYRLDFEEDKVFDDPSEVISNYMAYKCLYSIAPMELIWIKSGDVYVLCHTLSEYGILIDAFTGEKYVESTYGEQQSYEYSDIKGHWAEEKITKLAEIQIGLEGDEFNPDAPISQYDLLRLFAAGVYYQDYLTYSEDMIYENFIRDGIIKKEEKNPSGQVLREDAFMYMVRLDGLEKVAKLSNIFKVEYADQNLLSEGKIGYPAILTGMNIICGNGGYLKPTTPITRAEAAVMVYNYMINAN